jgi:pyridoxamine 5'-phosphate oxidase-like protein
VSEVIGPDEDAFLREHSRTFLLATRTDGSPTGWPMVGLYPGGALEFSTYGRSRKVLDLTRNPEACCVVAPVDSDRALILRGTAAVVDGQHEPSTGGDDVRSDINVADGIGERARERMKSGKRVVIRFTPTSASFVPGWQAR